MKLISVFIILFSLSYLSSANAGLELVCKGDQPRSDQKVVYVDCANRKAYVDTLGSAWRTLRKSSIGGSVENLCLLS